jgi:NAD(P)-dependent dehydrogenase (short-subunit alcohol dehydrogenase family)
MPQLITEPDMNLYLVTGTTHGLGAALAAQIAADRQNELIALSRAPDGPVPGGANLRVDLADSDAIHAVMDAIARRISGKHYGKAVLINNAGVIGPIGPLDRVDARELERNLVVNLVAPVLLMRRFLEAAAHVGVRRIINISSGAGRRPIFGWGAYCAAKAGLDMAARVAALEAETAKTAVEVVSLAPGVIDTAMQGEVRGASPEDFADVERFRAMKADGTLRPAADVAADILRLEREGKLKGDAVADLRALAG